VPINGGYLAQRAKAAPAGCRYPWQAASWQASFEGKVV